MTEKYGSRLLPTVLHDEATRNPSRPYAIIAKSNSIEDGFESVTLSILSRAVNSMASWLRTHFENGQDPERNATLAYIGVPDIRYNVVFLAGIRCRYKVFLTSPRNPIAVNASLFEQTGCIRLLYSKEVATIAKELKQAKPNLHCEEIPSLRDVLDGCLTSSAYNLKFEDIYQEPAFILHSSGSTATPKPVVCTHGTLATWDMREFPEVPGRKTLVPITLLDFPSQYIYSVFPPFHLAGLVFNTLVPLFGHSTIILGPSLRPPSGAGSAEIIRKYKPSGVYLPPVIIEQLGHEPDFEELMSGTDMLMYAGGPLSSTVGDRAAKFTRIGQFYGATEVGMMYQLLPDNKDWAWMEFNPYDALRLEPSGDGLSHELVVFADKDRYKTSGLQHNYPGLKEWQTKDLFIQHPTRPTLWKFHARRDDILVFSSGQKVNPLPLETYLMGVSSIGGALVVGQGHSSPGLLLEMNSNTPKAKASSSSEELWQSIVDGNRLLPAYGQIQRSMIIIADPAKPFKRAGKGTIVRRLTEDLYANEIMNLYTTDRTILTAQFRGKLQSNFQLLDIKRLIRSVLQHVSIDVERLDDDDNFYMYGVDFIKTAEALKYLKSGLSGVKTKAELDKLTLEIIYRNPNISGLASTLSTFLETGSTLSQRDRVKEMQSKIQEYTKALPRQFQKRNLRSSSQNTFCVAVTGTTGYLGGYLVETLTRNKLVSHVYCLNRFAKARQIFEASHTANAGVKLTFLQVDMATHHLGLKDGDYGRLLNDCEVIVHNAWRVNFNLHLSAFEDNLLSVREFMNLSAASPLRPRLVYVSSMSSTGWRAPLAPTMDSSSPQKRMLIPERIVRDLDLSMDMGYAESKMVAEQVLYAAANPKAMIMNRSVLNRDKSNGEPEHRESIPSTIIRLCQVAPANNTKWPDHDAMAAMFRTCKFTNTIPNDWTDIVDWIPVDEVALVMDDIVGDELKRRHRGQLLNGTSSNKEAEDNCRFYNLVNPHTRPWESLIPTLRQWCSSSSSTITTSSTNDTKLVKFADWLQHLHQIDHDNTATKTSTDDDKDDQLRNDMPALRILPIFDIAKGKGPTHAYEFENLRKISPAMRDRVNPIEPGIFAGWLKQL